MILIKRNNETGNSLQTPWAGFEKQIEKVVFVMQPIKMKFDLV